MSTHSEHICTASILKCKETGIHMIPDTQDNSQVYMTSTKYADKCLGIFLLISDTLTRHLRSDRHPLSSGFHQICETLFNRAEHSCMLHPCLPYMTAHLNFFSSSEVGIPDSKVCGANMGPIWGRQDPGGPHELCYLG